MQGTSLLSLFLFFSFSLSDASEKDQVQEAPCCSEAKYLSSYDLNCHAASDLKFQSTSDIKHQSTSDIKHQSTSDVKYQSTSDVECSNPSDSCFQGTSDTIYQSVYVMSDQKDECIIATEVRTHKQTRTQQYLNATCFIKLAEKGLNRHFLCYRCDTNLDQI